MKQYIVEVYTGDKFLGGTTANVFCTIYGDKGDTGEEKAVKEEKKAKYTVENPRLIPQSTKLSKIQLRNMIIQKESTILLSLPDSGHK